MGARFRRKLQGVQAQKTRRTLQGAGRAFQQLAQRLEQFGGLLDAVIEAVGEAKVKAVLDRRLAEREAAKVEAEALAAREPETVEAPTT